MAVNTDLKKTLDVMAKAKTEPELNLAMLVAQKHVERHPEDADAVRSETGSILTALEAIRRKRERGQG